jgi:hypothetical protein
MPPSNQQSASSQGVTATLWTVVEEIDDDDDDVLEITIDVANESRQDLWDIRGDVRAMDGTHGLTRSAPKRIESNDDDNLTFWIPADTGAWLFKLDYNTDSGPKTIELGPFTNEVRIENEPRKKNEIDQKMSSLPPSTLIYEDDPMASIFGNALDGFGESFEEDSMLASDIDSSNPIQAAFAGGLLESQSSLPNSHTTTVYTTAQVPTPAGPPSAPPAGPPSAPPAGPPSAPPAGPPSAPPAGPSKSSQPPGPPPFDGAKGPPGPPPS